MWDRRFRLSTRQSARFFHSFSAIGFAIVSNLTLKDLEAPAVPLDDPQTLEERTSYLTDGPRRARWLLGVFAGLALLLAAVGIYGVSAYLATERSHEIGIRMALGAGAEDIARLIYRGVLWPSAIGLGIGAGAAVGLMRLLRSMLFGVTAGDPKTLVAAGLTLLGVSVLAAAVPAVRAARSDPAKVLRRQ
jgi:ABC-type lipoprotein release transport system permease subunit